MQDELKGGRSTTGEEARDQDLSSKFHTSTDWGKEINFMTPSNPQDSSSNTGSQHRKYDLHLDEVLSYLLL